MASTINAITTGVGGVVTTADATGNLNIQNNGTTILAVTSSGVAVTGTLSATTITPAGVLPIANGGTNNSGLAVTAGGVVYTDGSKLVNVGAGSSGQFLKSNGASAPTWATSGLAFQSVQATGFTAVSGNIYPCNTTSAGFTVTLPASPSAGDQIAVIDYAGTFATNNLTISPNGNKIQGSTISAVLTAKRESTTLVYTDATQGWVAISAANESGNASLPQTYTASYLVVAGGGGGGGSNGAAGGGAGGLLSGSATLNVGVVYTATVGSGGAGSTSGSVNGTNGNNSVLSGSNISTITATGGGGGASDTTMNGSNGGSGGGASNESSAGTAGTGIPGQGNNGGNAFYGGNFSAGGGGGSSAVGGSGASTTGGNGGAGTASSITGSSITYAGGGGGGTYNGGTAGTGGSGGGGNAGTWAGQNNGSDGTANLGGGGGGASYTGKNGGSGGSGVVILSVPTASYSGTTTGSPTVTTSGSNTIIKFTASGTYTA